MNQRSSVILWAVAVVDLVGFAALIGGLLQLEGTFEGGYSTSTVGAPAYAALFTTDLPGRGWLAFGTAAAVIGTLLLAVALGIGARRGALHGAVSGRGRRVRPIGAALLSIGLIALAVGIGRLPRHMPKFGDEPAGFPDVPLHLEGRAWVEVGAALVLIGSASLLQRTWRALRPTR